MKKEVVTQKISDLESKLSAFGDIQTKAGEAESQLQRIRDLASQIDQDKEKSSQLKTEIQNTSDDIKTSTQLINEAVETAKKYQELIDSQNAEIEDLKKQGKAIVKTVDGLELTIKNQLGLVSSTVLSNAFEAQAKELKKSVAIWFSWIEKSTASLFIIAICIVLYQFSKFDTLWNVNFAIKLSLTTPVIFFLAFVTKQYAREKRLLDEYNFKSAVALSFEAYRKLIKEESAEGVDKNKVIEFVVTSVNNIYTSPMENMSKHKLDDNSDVDIDILGKIADILKRFIK